MPNINDYLIWRGDIKINPYVKYNEIDSMILARLSYLRFDKIEMKEEMTIEEASNLMKDFDNDEFLYNGDKELITNLGQSSRFKNMIITDYEKNNDREAEKQFGAVTVHISDKEMYVSYIGTDCSIYGWKEDLNMAFMESVPCQVAGKEYLERVAKKYPNKKIRIGGHSKGGNVAIYAAITSSKEVQDRIVKVYNYDGPGLSKNTINQYMNDDILKKIETYIPQDSVVGRILYHKEKITVVLSKEKGIYQHDIYSWQIKQSEIITVEKNTETSENINTTIIDWLENTTPAQRKIFADSLFELFYSTDVNTFSDIKKSMSSSVPKILKKYSELMEDDKKTMTAMIKVFALSYMSVVKEKETSKFKNKKDELSEKYFSRFKKLQGDK